MTRSPSHLGTEVPQNEVLATSTRPRILMVTPVSPANISSGSGQRTALMLEALKTCGLVDVLHLMPGATLKVGKAAHDPASPDGGWQLEAFAPEQVAVGRYHPQPTLTRAVERALGCTLGDYDAIVGRYAWGICQLVIPAGVRVVADLDDFRYRYGPQAPWTVATFKERIRKWVNHALLRRQLRRFDSVFFVSPLDQREQPHVQSVLLPNIPFSIAPPPSASTSTTKNVLFVGSLWYRPNAEGVDWLLRHVWPQVRSQVPDATLTLVGAAPVAMRETWSAYPGVEAPGFVDDLAKAYANAALVVVPIHSGGGTNIKVLEAIAYAKPCLVSGFTYSGFEHALESSKDLLVATTPEKFVSHCVKVLDDPGSFLSMGLRGRDTVLKKFSASGFQDLVRKSLLR